MKVISKFNHKGLQWAEFFATHRGIDDHKGLLTLSNRI